MPMRESQFHTHISCLIFTVSLFYNLNDVANCGWTLKLDGGSESV